MSCQNLGRGAGGRAGKQVAKTSGGRLPARPLANRDIVLFPLPSHMRAGEPP